jgi:predicted nuclease with TOPRIM domain
MNYPYEEELRMKSQCITTDSNYSLSQAKRYIEEAENSAKPHQSLEVQQAHRIGMLEADLNNVMQRLRETEQERNQLREESNTADRNATYAATRYTELVDRHNDLYQKYQKLVAKTVKKPTTKKRTVKK